MSMRHHWAELDALLAELDAAERFKRGRPHLAAVAARSQAQAEESKDPPAVEAASPASGLKH